MSTMVLCNDDIAYTTNPIKMCMKSLKSINAQILVLIVDPNPTKDNESKRNELCCRAHCLEVSNNESFSKQYFSNALCFSFILIMDHEPKYVCIVNSEFFDTSLSSFT